MAEPVSTPLALAAGASALVVALLGVEPQALAWAMVGAIFGAPLAPPAGRARQVLVFVGVTLASALLGTVTADWLGHASPRWRNAWCMVYAGVFHPLSAAVVAAIPNLVSTMLAAFAARRGAPPPTGGTDGPR